MALVDDADFESLNRWKWFAQLRGKTFYAFRDYREGTHMKRIGMHTQILGAFPIDHFDRDGLNNQRGNLRPATRLQNGANRGPNKNNCSGFKGVHWHVACKKWRALISINGKHKHLGLFDTPALAAKAYDEAARAGFGEFACTNQTLGLLR